MEKSLEAKKTEAEKEVRQLENQQKILLNRIRKEERNARNHRLIVHGAIMEGVFPFTASMHGESLKAFLLPITSPSSYPQERTSRDCPHELPAVPHRPEAGT